MSSWRLLSQIVYADTEEEFKPDIEHQSVFYFRNAYTCHMCRIGNLSYVSNHIDKRSTLAVETDQDTTLSSESNQRSIEKLSSMGGCMSGVIGASDFL